MLGVRTFLLRYPTPSKRRSSARMNRILGRRRSRPRSLSGFPQEIRGTESRDTLEDAAPRRQTLHAGYLDRMLTASPFAGGAGVVNVTSDRAQPSDPGGGPFQISNVGASAAVPADARAIEVTVAASQSFIFMWRGSLKPRPRCECASASNMTLSPFPEREDYGLAEREFNSFSPSTPVGGYSSRAGA